MSRTLGRRFMAAFAGVLAITLILMLLGVQIVVQNLLRDTIHTSVFARQNEMDNGVHLIFNEINYTHARIVFHSDFAKLVDPNAEEDAVRAVYQRVKKDIAADEEIFRDVAIVRDNLTLSETPVWFPDAFLREIEASETLVTQADAVNVGGELCLPVGKRLTMTPVPATVGYAIFLVKSSALGARCAGLAELGNSMIVRSNNYVVADDAGAFAGSKIFDTEQIGFGEQDYRVRTINGEKSILVVNEMRTVNRDYKLDWRIVSILNYDKLFASVRNMSLYMLLIGIAGIALGAVAAVLAARRLARPLRTFAGRIRTLDSGRAPAVAHSEIKEFSELEKAYDDMLGRIESLLETTRQDGETKRKLELDSLQMQINPHFLYNTLDAISWMAKINKQPEIDHMVLNLASLFRMSLHNGEQFIRVKEEFDLVRSYVRIQEIRFPDRFEIIEEADAEITERYTLKLILQPVVENAIKHGVAGLRRKLHIVVRATKEGDDILFEVIDDGVGFDANTIKAAPTKSGGYGLKNVHERLRLEYGDGYGIAVASEPGKGTRVTLRIRAGNLLNGSD